MIRAIALAFPVLCLLLLPGCRAGSVSDAVAIATNPSAATVGRVAARNAARYAADPQALVRDAQAFKDAFDALVEALTGEAGKEWGEKNVETPRPKEYVKYTQNYLSRALVDFDAGTVTVETLDAENTTASLRAAVATTLLTPDDPRSVDMYSDKPVKLGDTPFLYNEVLDNEGKPIRWAWRAERFAAHLVPARMKSRTIDTDRGRRTVHYVAIPMVGDHMQVRAKKYAPMVKQWANAYGVSPNLVFAVMRTESDFNPFAVSSAPAFGLMQIVPATAGRDVNQRLMGKDELPTREFLFVPDNNIRFGSFYLHTLDTAYLKGVADPVTRSYCVIAAYNGGAGNVLRTFSSDRSKALAAINARPPLEVYKALTQRHPAAETRRYLQKVMAARKDFVGL